MRVSHLTSLVAVLAISQLSPGYHARAENPSAATTTSLVSPAAPGSAQPQLAVAPDGTVYLSWLEKAGEGHRFRAAALRPGSPRFSDAMTIHEGNGFFANWADVPSIAVAPDGMLAAHWLQVSGAGKYAYDVRVRTSRDGGRTWSDPFTPHRDGTPSEHGFASFFPWPGGGLGLAWLDGRDSATRAGPADDDMTAQMSLRAAPIAHGRAGAEALVDERVCDCCPTAAALTSDGILLAYRDRSDDEVRDIFVTRLRDGKWSEGRAAARDNWQIAGCPVNGPSLSADGRRVVLAWFAAPRSAARVSVAFSDDSGETFGAPRRVDDGRPLGRVDAELLPDGSALVGWIEQLDSGAEFRVRQLWPDGRRGAAVAIAKLSAGRASGYPRIARSGNRLVFAWIGQDRVATATMEVGRLSSTR